MLIKREESSNDLHIAIRAGGYVGLQKLEVTMDRFDVVAWVSGALFIFVLVMDYLELLE